MENEEKTNVHGSQRRFQRARDAAKSRMGDKARRGTALWGVMGVYIPVSLMTNMALAACCSSEVGELMSCLKKGVVTFRKFLFGSP